MGIVGGRLVWRLIDAGTEKEREAEEKSCAKMEETQMWEGKIGIAAAAGSAGKSASVEGGESGADVLLIVGDGNRRWKARVEVDRCRNREGKTDGGKKLGGDGGNPDMGRENWGIGN
ncbi:unnamed protein product [Linum trigynum]|uniref:Uncharacterized protein n=1 Tax=Linum trigynum TaxID=586398 RepID=A0AAV2E7C2_9ROSI